MFLAAAAFGAGCGVEKHGPRHILGGANPDCFIKINRGKLAQRWCAIGVALQEDFEERQETVPRHAPMQLVTHHQQPHHAGEQLNQGKNAH